MLVWQDRHVGKIGFVKRFKRLQGGRWLYNLDAILQAIWSLSCAYDTRVAACQDPLKGLDEKKSSNTRYCILNIVVQMQPALTRILHPATKFCQNGNEVFLVLPRRHLWALLVSKLVRLILIRLGEYSQVLQLMKVCLCYRFHRHALDFPVKLGAVERGICMLAFISIHLSLDLEKFCCIV